MSDQDQDEYQSGVKTTPAVAGAHVASQRKKFPWRWVKTLSARCGSVASGNYIAYLSQKFNKSSTDAEDEWMYLRVFSISRDIAFNHAGELIVRIRVV